MARTERGNNQLIFSFSFFIKLFEKAFYNTIDSKCEGRKHKKKNLKPLILLKDITSMSPIY